MTRRTWAILLAALALALLGWLLRGDADGPAGGGTAEVRLDAAVDRGYVLQETERLEIDLRQAARAAIAGHVRDPKGRGIAGASVCAGAFGSGLSRAERDDRRCVVSEDDGGYRIDELLPVPHFVHASAPTFIPAPHRRGAGALASPAVRLLPGQEARDVDITLEPGGVKLTGVVRDLSGGELEGALVSSRYAYTRSAVDGTFTLWVKPGSAYVSASAEGYADGQARGLAPGQVFEVYLTPESVLVGRVVRADDGAPIEGAEVWAKAGTGWRQDGPALTDAGGNFRLEGLEPGAFKAEAFHDEAYGTAAEQVVLGLGETSAPVEIRAHPAFLVEGTVAIAGGGACERGTVRLRELAKAERYATIEPDGSVQVRGLLPGTYEVVVDCDNYVPKDRYDAIEIVDRSVRGVRWDVAPGQAIRGVVVTARGAPVPDLSVNAQPIADPNAPRALTTSAWGGTTDAEGRFELMGLTPGRYKVDSWSQDQPRPEPLEVELREGQDLEGVRLTLPATGELRGAVKDGEGRPVKGAEVSLRGDKWGLPSTRAIDDGTFRMQAVPAGVYRVLAGRGWQEMRAPGTSDDDDQGLEVTVAAGEVTRIDLVVESQTERISGHVVDADGGPLADAFIEATRESDSATAAAGSALRHSRWSSSFGAQEPKLTDQDGRFELTGLSAGNYTLVAHRRGGGEGTVEHVATGSEVEIRMADAGSLSGSVRIAGGGSPAQFSVSIRDKKSGYHASDEFFRTGGTFRFPEVPKGDYEVSVESPEGSSKAETRVSEGGRGEVQIELTPRLTVRGRVVDLESGAPVPGMRVQFSAGGSFSFGLEAGTGKDVTDTDGRFEVEKVPAGEVRASITPKGFADNDYGWTWLSAKIPTTGPAVELPAFKVVRQRTKDEENSGDLGYKLREGDPEVKPEAARRIVGFVRPGGPAAQAGLQVGDEIVSVDGHDVTGLSGYLYYELTNVAAGAKLRLGLARGASLELSADKPR